MSRNTRNVKWYKSYNYRISVHCFYDNMDEQIFSWIPISWYLIVYKLHCELQSKTSDQTRAMIFIPSGIFTDCVSFNFHLSPLTVYLKKVKWNLSFWLYLDQHVCSIIIVKHTNLVLRISKYIKFDLFHRHWINNS